MKHEVFAGNTIVFNAAGTEFVAPPEWFAALGLNTTKAKEAYAKMAYRGLVDNHFPREITGPLLPQNDSTLVIEFNKDPTNLAVLITGTWVERIGAVFTPLGNKRFRCELVIQGAMANANTSPADDKIH